MILRSRNGRTGGKIGFDFYAMFNCFVESDAAPEPSDDVALTGKKAGVFDKIMGKILDIAPERILRPSEAFLRLRHESILPSR